jgi:hypothetical protein
MTVCVVLDLFEDAMLQSQQDPKQERQEIDE